MWKYVLPHLLTIRRQSMRFDLTASSAATISRNWFPFDNGSETQWRGDDVTDIYVDYVSRIWRRRRNTGNNTTTVGICERLISTRSSTPIAPVAWSQMFIWGGWIESSAWNIREKKRVGVGVFADEFYIAGGP